MSKNNHTPTRRDNPHSFRHDKTRVTRRKRVVLFFGILAIMLLLLRTPAEHYLAYSFHFLLRPLYAAKSALVESALSYVYLLNSKKALAIENSRLRDALDAAIIESYAQKTLRAENDALKAAFYRYPERSFILAQVLASPGSTPYDTLVIDIGMDAGLFPGTRVFVDGDYVIGEVSQVFRQSALVALYSSSGNELSVRFGASSTPTTAHGIGGGNFRIILPKGIPVAVGDVIEVPELAPTFAGVVDAVERSETSSLQDIYFRWPFNISSLRHVYIEVEPVVIDDRQKSTP